MTPISHDPSRLPAIVLAAGLSSRMGAFKPLLPLGGKPLIGHVIEALQGSGRVEAVVVVTGHRAREIEAALGMCGALPDGRVANVFNPDFAQGEMLSSVKAGLRQVMERRHSATGCVLAFADQPAVLPSTVRRLVEAFAASCPPIALPTYKGKRGHPLVLAEALFAEILALGATETLRTVVERHRAHALQVPVEDASVLEDLDTPEDMARVRERYES